MPRLATLAVLTALLLLAACAGKPASETAGAPADSIASAADPDVPSNHCDQPGYLAPAGARLELSASVVDTVLTIRLHNAGTEAVCVYSHIATHEWQHDWLTVEVGDPSRARTLGFVDSRDKSAPVSVLLGPGQDDEQTVDLAAWAQRMVNGSAPLLDDVPIGAVIYDSSGEASAWAGRLVVVPTTGAASRLAP